MKYTKCIVCGKEFERPLRRKTCSSKCLSIRYKKTEKEKSYLSNIRKQYLKNNKHKHNGSLYRNKESQPEKEFKNHISKFNLNIVQWYIPPEINRYFELDFADIDNKIGFEINGNQHYNKDGTLKKYYKDRHMYFSEYGGNLIEIHYSICYDTNKLNKIIIETYNGNIEVSDNVTKQIFKHKEIKEKRRIKNELKLKQIKQEKINKKEELLKERREDLRLVNINKFGGVKIIAEKGKVSSTQVRRGIKKYYPDLNYYERKSPCSPDGLLSH